METDLGFNLILLSFVNLALMGVGADMLGKGTL